MRADDKKKARLNCIRHLPGQFPYTEVSREEVVLPNRERAEAYRRNPIPPDLIVPEAY